jgi:hypothetical protein
MALLSVMTFSAFDSEFDDRVCAAAIVAAGNNDATTLAAPSLSPSRRLTASARLNDFGSMKPISLSPLTDAGKRARCTTRRLGISPTAAGLFPA